MKKISVIIVTYNSIELILDCINSIYKFNDIGSENIQIIVVDNSPEEESKKMLMLLSHNYGEKLILIKNQKNLGYGHGNNIGIKASLGDLICIMNPDVRITTPIFFNVIRQFQEEKDLGILGYKQKGGKNISFYIKPEYFLPIINSILTKVANKLNLFSSKYFYLSGAFLFLDKSKFNEIGMFDENIFLYFEEPDISNRMLIKNYKIRYEKNYQYLHVIENREIWSEQTFKNWLSSINYYLIKFNFNSKKYFNMNKIEFIVKLFVARIFCNSDKLEKIRNEFCYLNNHCKSIS